ncbi:hypothetical protein ASE85_18905 [Sphingobium sp. Leaf26]|nr:hypothetical protein ASE85_18905 [Sphingobium sp. Leaf26]
MHLVGGLWVAGFAYRAAALIGAALIIVAFGVVGHSASRGLLTSVTVLLHVTTAAWWFGGLWVLLFASWRPLSDLAPLVTRFSRQAVWIIGVLLTVAPATAVLLLEFRFDPALAYQQGLLTKIGLTAVLLTLAGFNKLILMPRLVAGNGSRIWLRSTIAAEILLFAGVMGTTAYLVTYRSPHDAADAAHVHPDEIAVSGPICIVQPWAPAMPGGARTGAGYMVIVNNQPVADRLVAASSPWAEHVSLHASINDGNIARMRELAALRVPAGGRTTMKPGVYHLMFTGLYAPFVAGDVVPLTLVFERAGKVAVTLNVRPIGGYVDDHNH